MKTMILAALAALSIATAATAPAIADEITLHGMWSTYKSGK